MNERYDEWGGLAAETFAANSAIPGWEINTGLDQLGRLESLGVSKVGTGIEQFRIFHHYDQAGRLGSISSGGAAAHYGYEPAHQALRQIAITVNDAPVLYGNLQYDSLLQLRRISYHNGDLQGTLKAYSDFQYVRNDLGNITSITMKDRSKQLVGYNAAGEVVKTEHLLDAAGTDRRRGGNFAWTYDGIGNRLSAARGGDSAGANLRASTYTPNALNQYDSITQPGAVDVTGRAPLADTVTVNGDPVVRQGGRFHREVTADNSGGPVWKEILVANGTDSLDGFSLIPPATRTPVHDADGNLTHDGVHHYSWDAENRLIKIETLAAAVTAGVPYRRVEYLYDSNWRRVQRLRHDQPASTTPVESTRYLWAGWRCLAEVDAGGDLAKTFVWGLDSRQSLHLGDGNGALLWINDLTLAQRHFCHYDGNGNITGLSDATGTQTAEYLYNAFGELLERSGSYADKNLYRFSTKPFEEVGGLYYYGYRYYDPATGRWPSRDPLGENGGINLYGFVENDGVNAVDMLGLYDILVTITRTYHSKNETVGTFTVVAKSSKAAICCGSVSGTTLELPEGRYELNPWEGKSNGVKNYPIIKGPRSGQYSKSDTTSFNKLTSGYNKWHQIPKAFPTGTLGTHNINVIDPSGLFSGTRMHAGITCLSSRGCPIVGPEAKISPIKVTGDEPGSRPDQIGQTLKLHTFDYGKSLQKQLEISKFVECVQKSIGKKASIHVDINNLEK